MNSELLELFPGDKEVLLSADSVQFDDPGIDCPKSGPGQVRGIFSGPGPGPP